MIITYTRPLQYLLVVSLDRQESNLLDIELEARQKLATHNRIACTGRVFMHHEVEVKKKTRITFAIVISLAMHAVVHFSSFDDLYFLIIEKTKNHADRHFGYVSLSLVSPRHVRFLLSSFHRGKKTYVSPPRPIFTFQFPPRKKTYVSPPRPIFTFQFPPRKKNICNMLTSR
jgi:hypothetical protein